MFLLHGSLGSLPDEIEYHYYHIRDYETESIENVQLVAESWFVASSDDVLTFGISCLAATGSTEGLTAFSTRNM